MRNVKELYRIWIANTQDAELKAELLSMKDSEIEEAFFCDLEFGTGGLRGVMGTGTNRMNVYTVAKATRGLGNYILNEHSAKKRVAIGYDSRNKSQVFAKLAASILADMGIEVYIWSELLPTPMLSYAVRQLDCSNGIMITASHNPSKYNGYKVYRADGCQINEDDARKVSECIGKLGDFGNMGSASFEQLLETGKIQYISDKIYEDYIAQVIDCSMLNSVSGAEKSIKIVYSPLNGTGRRPVLDVLKRLGFENVTVIKEQEMPDGNFPTCTYPNPEIPEAMSLALKYAEHICADILLATDPDCDRVGVGVKNKDGSYVLLNGNEIGLLLLEFICKIRCDTGNMPDSAVVVKTIVTTDLAKNIADAYGVRLVNVLTGFKYIGNYIGQLESLGKQDDYIFGFEESCGYLSSGYVRDKDGVLAVMLVSELAARLKSEGKSLSDSLEDIYNTYGYCKNTLKSYLFEGTEGFSKIKAIMNRFRNGNIDLESFKVECVIDYLCGVDGLPSSDVIKFSLDDGSSFVIRPSGTEPKLKVYLSVNAENKSVAEEQTSKLVAVVERYIL